MDKQNATIIVPWDFTEISENSVLHAIQLAKVVDNEILLVHFMESSGVFSNKTKNLLKKEELESKLLSKAEDIFDVYKIRPQVLIEDKPVKASIKNILSTYKIDLIVMGKIYIAGKTKTSAKDFLKIIAKFNVPIIITKEAPFHTHYTELVVPVDYDRKFKESIQWILYLSNYYKCNINVIKPLIHDELKKKYLSNNIFFLKKMLDKKNIVYGIKTAKGKENYNQELFSFANTIEADLILIMSDKYDKFFSDKKVEELNKVPVMVINPRADLRRYQSFA